MYSPVGLLIGRGPNPAEWKRAVQCMKKVATTAENIDIQVAVEPLNRFETFFLNTCADATKIAKEVGSSHLGVHYDTFHQNIEEKDPVAALGAIGSKWLKHVHTCENDRGIPGTGHVPWDATMGKLKSMGYDGWYVIESFVPAIKELAKAACIWRPFAQDGDDLARQGLKFLKRYAA
jgi:D-psicose/D-tagatose/L-ribulose 3-epimerase